jgi:hypothetical protein
LILIEAFMDTPAGFAESALQTKAQPLVARAPEPLTVGLNAAIFAVRGDEPMVAVIPASEAERDGDGALPCGAFSPRQHATLEAGVRFWVRQQTGMDLGTTRQIGTLGDCRLAAAGPLPSGLPVVAVCYESLVGPAQFDDRGSVAWHSWYAYFPWEDWRRGKPKCLAAAIEPRLEAWAKSPSAPCEVRPPHEALDRRERLAIAFGWDGMAWDEESVLERYELLCEAGLAGEDATGIAAAGSQQLPKLWHPMLGDQARVLAGAIGELRRSVKCRPVIFELMPDAFTLFELQKTVEAILGPHLHKQNFRRLVEGGGLVEPTGEYRQRTGGRPAQLYRFRRDVLLERLAPGVRIKAARG